MGWVSVPQKQKKNDFKALYEAQNSFDKQMH